MTTALSLRGVSITAPPAIAAKPAGGLPVYGQRVRDFDTWRPGYAGAMVEVIIAGTTERAALFSDPYLGVAIENPQTLLTWEDGNGDTYGKFATPVYTYQPYVLYINATDSTGVERPAITDLAAQDISQSLVESTRGAYPKVMADFVDLVIHAAMFGVISNDAGSSLSTATLVAAIGAAAAQGGGVVVLPSGNIPYTPITLPTGVRLRGQGLNATTMRCQQSGSTITLGGDGAGLEELTVDGINLVAGSVGVHGNDVAQPHFRNVMIRRFETGIQLHGASAAGWHNFSISNCTGGADLRGDTGSGDTNEGAEIANIQWSSGAVSLCTSYGIAVRFVDRPAREIALSGVGFSSNVGPALLLHGARGFTARDCYWTGNTSDIQIEDDNNSLYADQNTTSRVLIAGGQISGGEILFNGTCTEVVFDGVEMLDVSSNLTVPTNHILMRDCIEDADCTSTGDTKKLLRWSSFDEGVTTGITTDATATVAWQLEMAPGEVGLFQAEAVGRARNDITYGIFWIVAGAARPAATLDFNLQTGNYTAGLVVTGATSGASARIVAVVQSAGSGTLTLRDIEGTFTSGELITDTSTGSARVSGSLGTSNVALDATGSDPVRADTITGSGWDVVFDVSGSMIQAKVTGEASKTIEWTVKVRKLVP